MRETRIRNMTEIAMMTALTCVLAQIAIPLPGGVPLTLQTFAVTLAGIVLGARKGAISMLIYVLLGAAGLPVFAGFVGGAQTLVGPTCGFLISFPIMAFLIGLGFGESWCSNAVKAAFLILGTAANYLVGTIMFALLMDSGLGYAFTVCVLPFIPTAVIKAALAWVVGARVKKIIPGGNAVR